MAFWNRVEKESKALWGKLGRDQVPAGTWKLVLMMSSPYFWLGCSSVFLGKPENIEECYHFVFDKLAHILYMGWGTYS